MKILKSILFFCLFTIIACQNKNAENVRLIEKEIPTADANIRIEYIAHACFILEANGTRIMIDPYADRVWLTYDFPKHLKTDAVFISHPHYDHDGGIFRGKRPDWMFDTPFYQNPKTYKIGDFDVEGIIGKHADPYGKEFGQMNTIWKLKINGVVFAHWGDNGQLTYTNIKALSDVDVLFMPMDGDYHIIPKEVYFDALNAINPTLIIPMHYRIPEVELHTDSPKTLGELEPFLEKRPKILTSEGVEEYLPKVNYLKTNTYNISLDALPSKSTYLVFKHSPLVIKTQTQ